MNEHPTNKGITYNPTVAVFLDRNCRYISLGTQIPHDSGLALIPSSGQFSPLLPIEPVQHPAEVNSDQWKFEFDLREHVS